MKTASKVMYILGAVGCLLGAVVAGLFAFFLADVALLQQVATELGVAIESVKAAIIFTAVTGIPSLIAGILCIIGAVKVSNGVKGQNAIHIVNIVIGALSILNYGAGLFAILGGIFGIVAENQQ